MQNKPNSKPIKAKTNPIKPNFVNLLNQTDVLQAAF
jgi:hypothetical protein